MLLHGGGVQDQEDGVGNGGWYHQGAYQNGYYAGTQDAIYDHEHNLVYTDQPSCLSCHSQLYLDGFKHGYSQEWNSYQAQNTDQRVNVYVNNSPGAEVNVGQTSTQGQDGSIGPGGQDGDYGP